MKAPMTIPRTDSRGKYRQPLTGEQAAELKKLSEVFSMTPEQILRRRHSLPGQPKLPETVEVEVVFKDRRIAKLAKAIADYQEETVEKFIGDSILSDLQMFVDDFIFHPKTGAVVLDILDFKPSAEARAARQRQEALEEAVRQQEAALVTVEHVVSEADDCTVKAGALAVMRFLRAEITKAKRALNAVRKEVR